MKWGIFSDIFGTFLLTITMYSGLTSLTIPNSVTSMGHYAFSECGNLTSLTIEEGVTHIGDYAFVGCSGLTSLTVPDSVTRIGYDAFFGCSNLTSITIGKGVTSIGFFAFEGCSALANITVAEGNNTYDSRKDCNAIIFTAKNTLVIGCKNTEIPDGVTGIESYAFVGCSGLTSLTIPDSMTSIGDNAFDKCSSLKSIVWNGKTYTSADEFLSAFKNGKSR